MEYQKMQFHFSAKNPFSPTHHRNRQTPKELEEKEQVFGGLWRKVKEIFTK
jgi:hypothetical protein